MLSYLSAGSTGTLNSPGGSSRAGQPAGGAQPAGDAQPPAPPPWSPLRCAPLRHAVQEEEPEQLCGTTEQSMGCFGSTAKPLYIPILSYIVHANLTADASSTQAHAPGGRARAPLLSSYFFSIFSYCFSF